MTSTSSGMTFSINAMNPEEHRLEIGLELDGPFTSRSLHLKFPRWVPGSYFLREPIQHMFNFTAEDEDGDALNWKRMNVDGMVVHLKKSTSKVRITYDLFARELSVRSNHFDSTHLHMMPPYTWFWPTKGIDPDRCHQEHRVELTAPESWHAATQLTTLEKGKQRNGGRRWAFSAPNRDALLDSIMEVNPNAPITRVVDGRPHHLKIWDSGGHEPNPERLAVFQDDMEKIIKEHHALFGVPSWGEYTVVLQLTDTGRGGLEHMNSQTSMMPRSCLFPGHEEEYRDLVSLFSHEYLHQWNVKRLKPTSFLDYDLQSEGHTDLLWWFEGGTSWLGDMMCVRSGAWSEEDWRLDFMRKMNRHKRCNGCHRESLAESSHDAWIHLYRGGPYTRESQISYYLEGELAMMCLDVELRRRNKNTYGACDLMAEVCANYAMGATEPLGLGVEYQDIRKTLQGAPGGQSMGPFLDRLVKHRTAPPVEKAMSYFRLKLGPERPIKDLDAWLGVGLKDDGHRIRITTFHQGSPLRNLTQVGDEILAVNGLRVKSSAHLSKLVLGRAGQPTSLDVVHEGVLTTVNVSPSNPPGHGVKLDGNGNEKWRMWLQTRQGHSS